MPRGPAYPQAIIPNNGSAIIATAHISRVLRLLSLRHKFMIATRSMKAITTNAPSQKYSEGSFMVELLFERVEA
ncbi:hypothetical protein RU08_02295 [Pseudomonas fulva]|uniref:Uncharacterized protein n=1 Tax=Pseudomonas fulva TaxID=47880 RepID=A0A0D0L537_9PSED|nr:hypothetical protein RU08_02295 [Pseudomonas fulva]